MASHMMQGRLLDARPDRIDFRDKPYRPPLISLPSRFPRSDDIARFLPEYHRSSKILDQGTEGACTGFGLAAVINYIIWDRWMREGWADSDTTMPLPPNVSPWMLYDNARVYDEWEGEGYSGSSCRGAMKGWHKHGVCRDEYWKRRTKANPRPDLNWRSDAALRPLGSYYRVNASSISDMQSAIHEVRAVYSSARVHKGWLLDVGYDTIDVAGLELPIVPRDGEITGGHAFAIVGYTEHGFIVQNSWGEDWGFKGFALVAYADWIENGNDAWVASMAAPMQIADWAAVPTARSSMALGSTTAFAVNASHKEAEIVRPWSETQAYEHAVVLGNDGKPLRRLIDTSDAVDNLRKVILELPAQSAGAGLKHVLLYAHGGLNSEAAAIQRTMRLGPWFEANGIHPIFIVWRTSLLDSLGQIGQDVVGEFLKERDELRVKGIGDLFEKALQKLQEKFDKAFEAAAEQFIGKPVWMQMKQNARAAATGAGGSRQIVKLLEGLREQQPDISIHMLGHSAGSIMLGHMLDDMNVGSGLETLGLYAPACTTDFANKHFGRALKKGTLPVGRLHVDNLSETNERDDAVGPYGKSILFLVSRAFEEPRKMPLLGFERCWASANDSLLVLKEELATDFAEHQIKDVQAWAEMAAEFKIAMTVHREPQMVARRLSDGELQIKTTHGNLDNALTIVNDSVRRILGTQHLPREITDLTGF